MGKFKIKEIENLVNESLDKYLKKKALISERRELERELKKLNEVTAGKEMSGNNEYHKGQRKPEFIKKGSHMLEDEEGLVAEMDNDFNDSPLDFEDESMNYGTPKWMNEIEEEVDLDQKIKSDLYEMLDKDMADEISCSVSDDENDFDDEGSDFDDDYEESNYNEEDEEKESLFESLIKKRRNNIMSESTKKRMQILSGQKPRWDNE